MMTLENKTRVENEIKLRNWIRIEDDCHLPQEEEIVELICEDMDGQPFICKAHISEGKWRGDSNFVKDNYMCMCIAWRTVDIEL